MSQCNHSMGASLSGRYFGEEVDDYVLSIKGRGYSGETAASYDAAAEEEPAVAFNYGPTSALEVDSYGQRSLRFVSPEGQAAGPLELVLKVAGVKSNALSFSFESPSVAVLGKWDKTVLASDGIHVASYEPLEVCIDRVERASVV